MKDCIFCKIANKQIPKEFTYESENIMVFPDIHPVRPVHLLIVPKKHIADFVELKDEQIWQEMREATQKLLHDNGLTKGKGYRLSVNGGGAQLVNHLHLHIMGPVKNTESV